MRALVTGGAGFIGSNIVDALIARGADVVVLDDLSTGFEENIHPSAELVVGDVADPGAVAKAVAGCEVVFHEAAHRAVFRSVERPIETDRANVGGTLAVLVGAKEAGARRVVTASSSVYGGAGQMPTPEDAPICRGPPTPSPSWPASTTAGCSGSFSAWRPSCCAISMCTGPGNGRTASTPPSSLCS